MKDPVNTYKIYKSSAGMGKCKYIDKIADLYPTVLHELYRYAISVLGANCSTKSLVFLMNRKAKVTYPNCPVLSNLALNSYHFWLWFNRNNGKLKEPTTKPRVTQEQMENRVKWAESMLEMIETFGEQFYVCFLDEKWFYTTSRRKKYKILPKAPFETEEQAYVQMPRVRSRKHALKLMYQGIVGNPVPEKCFDGMVLMERVCEEYESSRRSFNQNISIQYELNHALKRGEWRELFYPIKHHKEITVELAIECIKEMFDLEQEVCDNLCFSYKTYSKNGTSQKTARIFNGKLLMGRMVMGNDGTERPLKIQDLTLHKNIPRFSILQRDVSCDSTYMLRKVGKIGASIRKAYHWTEMGDQIIYLVIDNAGGHGTIEAKREFERILDKEYNISVIWQVPNSPETNMLDLGVWMCLQSAVEHSHRLLVMKQDVLSDSVLAAMDKISSETLSNIYNRWVKVLHLIMKGKGNNQLVERCRGKNDNVEELVYVDIHCNNNTVDSDDSHSADEQEEDV